MRIHTTAGGDDLQARTFPRISVLLRSDVCWRDKASAVCFEDSVHAMSWSIALGATKREPIGITRPIRHVDRDNLFL